MAVNKVIYGGNTLVDLTGDTVTATDLADGVKATGADGNHIVGLMQKVTIDAELSATSTNPVQNKVIAEAIANIGSGGGGGVSTSEVNTWTAAQIFNDVTIGIDAGKINTIKNSTATPTTSYTVVVPNAPLLTLDFSALSAQVRNDALKMIKFKILILTMFSTRGLTLKVINAGDVGVPENTNLGRFINLLDGMILSDEDNSILTILHISKQNLPNLVRGIQSLGKKLYFYSSVNQ